MYDIFNIAAWLMAYVYLFIVDWKLALVIFLIIGSNNHFQRKIR